MKTSTLNLSLAFLVSLGAVACAETSTLPPPPGPPVDWASFQPPPSSPKPVSLTATAKERQVAQLYASALAAPSLFGLGPLLDDEVHFRFAGGKDVHGKANTIEAYQSLLGPVGHRSIAVTRVLLTDSSQSVEWVLKGVHQPTQTAVVIQGVTLLWTKDDGLITDIHLYFDEAAVQAQLGVGPEKLREFSPSPAASTAPVQVSEQQKTPQEDINVQNVRAQLQALEDQTELPYLRVLADDAELRTLEAREAFAGRAWFRNYFTSMHRALGYLATSIENIWGSGSFVVVEYQIVGEQRAPIGWVPLRGERLVRLSTVDILEMSGGAIVRVSRYDNPAQIASAQ